MYHVLVLIEIFYMTTFHKSITDPWFTQIRTGKKPYECFVGVGWKGMKDGDLISYTRKGDPVYLTNTHIRTFTVRVTHVATVKSFEDACELYGNLLLPGISKSEREKVYEYTYNSPFNKKEIEINGISIFRLDVI